MVGFTTLINEDDGLEGIDTVVLLEDDIGMESRVYHYRRKASFDTMKRNERKREFGLLDLFISLSIVPCYCT